MQSKSQTRMRLILLAVLQAAVLVTSVDVEDRDKRQTQPYYTASIPSRGPTPKPQPFASGQQTIVPRFPPFSPAPQGFRSSPADDEADQVDRNAVSPTPQYLLVRPQPTQQPAQYRSPAPQQIHQQQQQQSNQQQQQRARPPNNQDFRRPNINQKNQQQLTEEELAELEEEEKEEPDRLTQLLPNSKFSCSNRNTGYYADEGLNCEVFHYCQDNARHSWICPEGFLFHQVHLICMPPSSDNICKQSSNYHFVNDYLYRPINEEEVQRKPNVTLRYADRYYPENYYEEEENHAAPQPAQVRRPVQQNPNYQQQIPARTPVPQQYRQASTTNQVFHSPEEVNIPLQHRRPQYQQSSQSEEEY